MSTRLIMPVSEESLLRTRPPQLPRPPPPPPPHRNARRACRVLFGRPTREETVEFYTKEMRVLQEAAGRKYGFDFEKGVPIGGPAARYVYTSCEIVPLAPVKKRPADVEDLDDSDRAYFKPEDVILGYLRENCESDEPREEGEVEREPLKEKKQTSITDYFMQQRKRNASMAGEKSDSPRIPAKIAKLDTKS